MGRQPAWSEPRHRMRLHALAPSNVDDRLPEPALVDCPGLSATDGSRRTAPVRCRQTLQWWPAPGARETAKVCDSRRPIDVAPRCRSGAPDKTHECLPNSVRYRRVLLRQPATSAIPCQPPLISIEASLGMPPRMLATASVTASNAPSTVTFNATRFSPTVTG